MKVVSASKGIGFRLQKVGVILTPPAIAGCCLLVDLTLLSTALVTVASVIPASLYNRHLTIAQREGNSEVIEDKNHLAIYRTSEGLQIIAFYKIIRRPQGYSLHTLKASYANSNLAIYPLLHANGPFLAFRFSDKGHQSKKHLILEVPQLMERLIQTIMRKFPGLELAAAASADVRALMSIFRGQSKNSGKDSRPPPGRLHEQNGALAEKLRLSVEHLQNHTPTVEKTPSIAKFAEFSAIRAPIKAARPIANEIGAANENSAKSEEIAISLASFNPDFSNNTHLVENNEEALEELTRSYEKIAKAVESIQRNPNSILITSTGKKIAGRLVIKEARALLEIMKNLAGLPAKTQDRIDSCYAYLEKHFGISDDKSEDVLSNDLWQHIPGAAKMIEDLLRDLLST